MRIKFLQEEDFLNYKKCSMFIGVSYCDWKCCKELNLPCSICQNNGWSNSPIKEISNKDIVNEYLKNDITESIVIGGLEPFLQFEELMSFISTFRKSSNDDIVIYTGYYKTEIEDKIKLLQRFPNIIVKFGRYIPNRGSRFDDILGVVLASNNQYAEKIS